MNKRPISWDFDWTLFNPFSNSLIKKTHEIFKKQLESGEQLCITTYRSEFETKEIKDLFPGVPIYCTNEGSKIPILKSINAKAHYDDDWVLCVELMGSDIKPIYIHHPWANVYFLEGMEVIEIEDERLFL